MVYRHISTDMKCRALQLLDNGWELEEITEVLGISKESVDRWLDNYATVTFQPYSNHSSSYTFSLCPILSCSVRFYPDHIALLI